MTDRRRHQARRGGRGRTALLPLLLAAATPAQDDLITLSVRDEQLANLLEALSVQHRLNLVADAKIQGTVTMSLFDVPLHRALEQILATQGLGYVVDGEFHRIMTLEERQALLLQRDVVETRVFHLDHLTSEEARQLLTPLLSTDGRLSLAENSARSGGGAGASGQAASSSGHRETIVVQDRASRLAAVANTIQQLDQPPQQVLLEATILSVDLGEDNRLGVDFNVLAGIDFEDVGANSNLTGIGGYNVPGGRLNDPLFSGQTFGFTTDPPTQGLSLGFIKNGVAAFVEALEQTTNTTIVSNPKVLALNGHEAQIIVGGRLGYTTLVTTETSSVEQVQFLDTGTKLVFRPFIGNDGWIRMEVHPQSSNGVVDPVSGIPSETTTEITTNILMRDGQTLILGGLISDAVTTSRSQVPFLGNIPLLGALFGRTQDSITRKELVILLTPHILDPVEAQQRADQARQRFAAVQRSHWESLSPYIRPVLARSHGADASVLRARGDLPGALGAAERALALNPTDADTAVLREQLLEELALARLPGDDEERALQLLDTKPRGAQKSSPPVEGH